MSDLTTLVAEIKDDAVCAAVRAVVVAGDETKAISLNATVKTGDGHRSIVTEADSDAEKILVNCLLKNFPNAKILSEEDASGPNMLDKNNPAGILDEELVFVIDPIDGTAPRASNLATWCVSAGIMRRGTLIGSAVYAPAINGGMLIWAELGETTHVAEWNFQKITAFPNIPRHKPKDSFVMVGVDSTLYPSFLGVLPEIAANVRCVGVANSGILGLAQVACQRAQAIIQTPQKAWDWAGAYYALLQSGNVFCCFRLVPDPYDYGMDMLVEEPSDAALGFDAFRYLPKQNRLGFVAGEPDLCGRVMDLLPRHGWARTNPDAASGNWK